MVLSQITSGRSPVAAPMRSDTARTAAMSTSVLSGFEGVSIMTRLRRPSLAASRAAAAIASGSPPSLKPCAVMPRVDRVRVSRVSVPP